MSEDEFCSPIREIIISNGDHSVALAKLRQSEVKPIIRINISKLMLALDLLKMNDKPSKSETVGIGLLYQSDTQSALILDLNDAVDDENMVVAVAGITRIESEQKD